MNQIPPLREGEQGDSHCTQEQRYPLWKVLAVTDVTTGCGKRENARFGTKLDVAILANSSVTSGTKKSNNPGCWRRFRCIRMPAGNNPYPYEYGPRPSSPIFSCFRKSRPRGVSAVAMGVVVHDFALGGSGRTAVGAPGRHSISTSRDPDRRAGVVDLVRGVRVRTAP